MKVTSKIEEPKSIAPKTMRVETQYTAEEVYTCEAHEEAVMEGPSNLAHV